MYSHHGFPLVIMSPEDSKIENVGPHICRFSGKRAYIGQDSWDRQLAQLKLLLEYDFNWFLLNDSDSFVLTPELPGYLYESIDTVYSNEVTDFRIPGETWTGEGGPITWPLDFHKDFPLIAMQPPYFMSRRALSRLVTAGEGAIACPITPFIDWWFPYVCTIAKLNHRPFVNGASCETVTENGILVMSECILKRGATFIHSVKSKSSLNRLLAAYNSIPK